MKAIIKSTLILLAITLISGLALAFVHGITEEPIKIAEEEAKLAAFRAVFPEAEEFTACEDDISAYVPADGVIINEVNDAVAGSEVAGWVMNITSPNGYGGDISLAVGITSDGTLNGIKVISMEETPGLGANCTSEEFQSQFSGIKASSIEFTKSGKTADNEIDAISGATFTTRAVTQAVNAGLGLAYEYLMTGGGN